MLRMMIGAEDGICVACGRDGQIGAPILWPLRIGPIVMLLLAELPLIGGLVYAYWPQRWRKIHGVCACCLPEVAIARHEMVRRHGSACPCTERAGS